MKKIIFIIPLVLFAVGYFTKEGTQFIIGDDGTKWDSVQVNDTLYSDYYLTTPIQQDNYILGKFYFEIAVWGPDDSVHLLLYKQYSDIYDNSGWLWGEYNLVEQIDSAGYYTFYEPLEGHQAIRFSVFFNSDSTYSLNTYLSWVVTTK